MTSGKKSIYAIVWEYRVRRGRERQFERIYGPRGAWAHFFRKGRGHRGTHLYRETARTRCYVTVDLWASRAAFAAFHRNHHSEYARIDRQCDALTEKETRIGAWTVRL